MTEYSIVIVWLFGGLDNGIRMNNQYIGMSDCSINMGNYE